jgi:Ca2+-dependent lipid-binding protein
VESFAPQFQSGYQELWTQVVARPHLQSASLHQGPAEGEEPEDTMARTQLKYTYRQIDMDMTQNQNKGEHQEDRVSKFSNSTAVYNHITAQYHIQKTKTEIHSILKTSILTYIMQQFGSVSKCKNLRTATSNYGIRK